MDQQQMAKELNQYYGSDRKVAELIGRSEMYINLIRRGKSVDIKQSDLKNLKKLYRKMLKSTEKENKDV